MIWPNIRSVVSTIFDNFFPFFLDYDIVYLAASLHIKGRFLLRISSVNVTKSAVSCSLCSVSVLLSSDIHVVLLFFLCWKIILVLVGLLIPKLNKSSYRRLKSSIVCFTKTIRSSYVIHKVRTILTKLCIKGHRRVKILQCKPNDWFLYEKQHWTKMISQLTLTCSKSKIKTLEKDVKYVQS